MSFHNFFIGEISKFQPPNIMNMFISPLIEDGEMFYDLKYVCIIPPSLPALWYVYPSFNFKKMNDVRKFNKQGERKILSIFDAFERKIFQSRCRLKKKELRKSLCLIEQERE
jgi:hypothetical protein